MGWYHRGFVGYWKAVAITRIAVRETGVSWHHRGAIQSPPESPRKSQHYRIGEFKGGLQLGTHYAERLCDLS